MLMAVVMGIALASVPLFGGRISRLVDLDIRHAWLVLVSLAVQVAVISVFPDADPDVLVVALVASYLLGGAFLLVNAAIPGMWLIVTGAGLNAVVILANGGVMPADPAAVDRAAIESDHEDFVNSAAKDDARLDFLGDNFAWPAPLPFANVFSVGDIVLVVGAVVVLHRACGTRLPGRARRTAGGGPSRP